VPIPKKNDLEERLARYPQIKITVVGGNSGKTISNPVWFVLTCGNSPTTRIGYSQSTMTDEESECNESPA
jgi:hypothetical protein